ncbi:MAG: ribonuclease HI, partial [Myxococcales bacterium]|nr:ribonuclease HI [Myxococcales bacterium]
AIPEGAIAVWTDGACTGNPGPCGIGVVVVEDGERREASEYLGEGTNNIAELVAIERGLELVRDRQRCVLVHSDSSYALGLLGKNWKAKANAELVARLRKLAGEFADVRWIKVKGHAGVPENERCDQLARDAITNRGRR